MKNNWGQSVRICNNCGERVAGYKNKNGLLKIQCPACGVFIVYKRISRRHERIDVFVPPSEAIDN